MTTNRTHPTGQGRPGCRKVPPVPTSLVSGPTGPDEDRQEQTVKYVILIHSNPQPWGHPTSDFLAEHQALSQEQRDAETAAFEALLTELSQNGELVGGEPLAAPSTASSTAGTPDGRSSPTAPTRRRRSTSLASSSSTSRPRNAPRPSRRGCPDPGRPSSCGCRCPTGATTSEHGLVTVDQLEDVRRVSRHASSARCCADTATTPTARTPPRGRRPPRPNSGRQRVCRTTLGLVWSGRVPPPRRPCPLGPCCAAGEETAAPPRPPTPSTAPPADEDTEPGDDASCSCCSAATPP